MYIYIYIYIIICMRSVQSIPDINCCCNISYIYNTKLSYSLLHFSQLFYNILNKLLSVTE